jgi:hypothetical protein
LASVASSAKEPLTRLSVFRDQILTQVFPAFADIEQEAREHSDAVLGLGSQAQRPRLRPRC